jgi:hypothetical protein
MILYFIITYFFFIYSDATLAGPTEANKLSGSALPFSAAHKQEGAHTRPGGGRVNCVRARMYLRKTGFRPTALCGPNDDFGCLKSQPPPPSFSPLSTSLRAGSSPSYLSPPPLFSFARVYHVYVRLFYVADGRLTTENKHARWKN